MNKNVIITGGSQGIGRNIVYTLAREGCNIIFSYNNSEKEAQEIKEELLKEKCNVEIFKADISKKTDIDALVQFAINKFKNIDVLINNAGISQIKLFTDITEEDWNNIVLTNLSSVFFLTQGIAKNMINNQSGCIINISSIWGDVGASCEVHYSTVKAGVNGFTKALAKELGFSGIRVNAISPGIIDTRMNEHLSVEEKEELKEEIPLRKIGKPEDISKCVKWLIEDEYTTGQIISINGGWGIR